jgi:four helix bundle protein
VAPCVGREGNDENGKLKGGAMKNENGRMKGDSNGEDEKMRAENGRIKGDLKERTKQFSLNIITLYSQLPKRREAQVLGDQLLRSGTSVGAHFREAQRAKSNPDFISKIEGGMQELEETAYWLECSPRLSPEQRTGWSFRCVCSRGSWFPSDP